MAWHRHVASHAQRTAATWHVVVASVAAEFSLDIELVTEVYFPLAAACRIEVMRVPQCLATRQRTAQSTFAALACGCVLSGTPLHEAWRGDCIATVARQPDVHAPRRLSIRLKCLGNSSSCP